MNVSGSSSVSGLTSSNGLNVSSGMLYGNGGMTTNGLTVSGKSKSTVVGGVIPLGNVIAGNMKYGIYLTDIIEDFTSINTFCGLAAFGNKIPNGSDGILMDSHSNNIEIRLIFISVQCDKKISSFFNRT